MDRRNFLKSAAATGAAALIPGHGRRAARNRPHRCLKPRPHLLRPGELDPAAMSRY